MENSIVKISLWKILKSSGSWKTKLIKLFDLIFGTLIACLVKSKLTASKLPTSIQRLLIIRPGGIGDAIFLLPILSEIKKTRPGMIIDILCEKRNREAFETQRHCYDHTYCYDDFNSFMRLFPNRYDIVIDTEQWHYLSALVAYFLSSSSTIGFATRPLRTKLLNKATSYELDGYELDNFKRLFEDAFGSLAHIRDINSCYLLSPEVLSWGSSQVPDKNMTFFLGASIPERRLTHQQNLTLLKLLLEKNLIIVLLGGKDVIQSSLLLKKDLNHPKLLNFVGKLSLEQSASLIKQSQLFIGTDSGLMHLACAVGTPVIAIFGPGNLKKWEPKGDKHSIITENVECSPCTRFGYTVPTCRGSYHCMRNINIESVNLKVNEWLKPK